MELLFNIPNPLMWTTDQVANVISLVSAAATVTALWYAFYRNRKQDKKINDLAEITSKLARQNELVAEQVQLQKAVMRNQVRPIFELLPVTVDVTGKMGVHLRNIGYKTYIDNIKMDDSEVKFRRVVCKIVEASDTLKFSGESNSDKSIYECMYTIRVYHSDVYGNRYLTEVDGAGSDVYSFNTFDEFDNG